MPKKHRHSRENETEAGRARRTRKKRRFWIRLLVLIVLAALVALVALNWETLAPETVTGNIHDLMSGGSGGDGFPVNVAGSQIFQMEYEGGSTILLSDTYVTMLNNSGVETMRRTHAFSDPQLRVAGKYALVAELGGKRLQLETRSKTVQEINASYDILTAAVHKSGRVAVVTGSDQGYNAEISVYSPGGELIYHRLCSNLIADLAFSPSGKQLAVAAVGAEGGAMTSTVEVLSLGSGETDPLYTHSEKDALLYRVQYLSDTVITAVGDAGVWMYQPKRDTCKRYDFSDGSLQAFAIGDKGVLAVTKPYGSATGGTAALIKTDGTAAFTETFEGVCRDVASGGNTYTLLTDKEVYQLSGRGIAGSREVPSDGRLVATSGNRIMVLGLNVLTQHTAPHSMNEPADQND